MRVSAADAPEQYYEDHMEDSARLDRFLREPQVRQITGLSRVTRWRMEQRGDFPRRRQISLNAVAWLETEIREWMQAKAGTA